MQKGFTRNNYCLKHFLLNLLVQYFCNKTDFYGTFNPPKGEKCREYLETFSMFIMKFKCTLNLSFFQIIENSLTYLNLTFESAENSVEYIDVIYRNFFVSIHYILTCSMRTEEKLSATPFGKSSSW